MKNLISGLLLFCIGLFFSIYSVINYEFGILSDIGPAFFPLIIGVLLTLSGIAIIFIKDDEQDLVISDRINWTGLISIIIGITLFAILMNSIGIFLSTFIAMLCFTYSTQSNIIQRLMLSLIISILSQILFMFLLN